MASLEELRNERLKKVSQLRDRSIDPYPSTIKVDYSLAEIRRRLAQFKTRRTPLTLAGRVMGIRAQGNLIFFDLDDGTAQLQALARREAVGEESLAWFETVVDRGDWLAVTGSIFLTKTKEPTILAKSWQMAAKSLRPLPDKWHGLTETEERFRRRYLDSLFNEEVRARFRLRSLIIRALRAYLDEAGYLEVETPMLQSQAGGAAALPFKTHEAALDLDLYLRISPELYLKQMLIGGFPKVYELSRCFRNEGIDATHHPEFTMLEFYEAYSDAGRQRQFVERLFKYLVKRFSRGSTLNFGGEKIDFQNDFRVVSYYDLFKRYALITDPVNVNVKDLMLKAAQFGVPLPAGAAREKIFDLIYKKVCRPKLIQPTFVIDYPKAYLPLAKAESGHPELADAFQLVIAGLEIVKAFSELNDPMEQRARFLAEEKQRQAGETETQPLDEEYIEALEYGLPPAGGVGIGVDRLVMLFTDTPNIREVIYFPTLRPKS
ncbi:MAG: lysine--tRNA ligase [Candidatus Vogelbacteria bacterium]|nr:lysine--tRNA ligase [Candidatus Vogelbacteria bacterium]